MRPEMSVCANKMSVKNDLEGACVFACMCKRTCKHMLLLFIIGQQQKPVISLSS